MGISSCVTKAKQFIKKQRNVISRSQGKEAADAFESRQTDALENLLQTIGGVEKLDGDNAAAIEALYSAVEDLAIEREAIEIQVEQKKGKANASPFAITDLDQYRSAKEEAAEKSRWSERVNGFTNEKFYAFNPDTGQYHAFLKPIRGTAYTIEYMKGNDVIETDEISGNLTAVKLHVSEYIDGLLASESQAGIHVEAGQVERVTPAVIDKSLKKSADNTAFNPKEAQKWLITQVNAAIKAAPDARSVDAWDAANKKVSTTNIMNVEESIGFKVFDVPGDGKFKVLNVKEKLEAFKANVEKNAGFKAVKNKGPQLVPDWQKTGKSASEGEVREMLVDGDYTAAYEFSKQIGKPLVFGSYDKSNASTPIIYTDARPFTAEGYEDFDFVVAKSFDTKEKTGRWFVIERSTGLSVGGSASSQKAAEIAVRGSLSSGNVTPESMAKIIAAAIKIGNGKSQDVLASEWLAWAGEKEGNDSIIAKQKEEAKKPELQRANEALDAEIKARDEREAQDVQIDPKGFERFNVNSNGTFELRDGNMIVRVEPTENGKYQASFRGAKSSPHLQGIQGAVDWADAYRQESIRAESQQGVPTGTTSATTKSVRDENGNAATEVTLPSGKVVQIQKLNSAESMGLPGWHGPDGYLADTKEQAVKELERKDSAKEQVVPSGKGIFVDRITGEEVSLTDAQRDFLANANEQEKQSLAAGKPVGQFKLFGFDGSKFMAITAPNGDRWMVGLLEEDGRVTGAKDGRHNGLMSFAYDDRRVDIVPKKDFDKTKETADRIAQRSKELADEESKPTWYNYTGVISVFPRSLIKMNGRWYRIGENDKLLLVGRRSGDASLLDSIHNSHREWVPSKKVDVSEDGRVLFDAAVDAKKEEESEPDSAISEIKDGKIEDFGQKLGGAKKDLAKIRAIDVALTDADIAGLPLSKIWPASEIDDIENKFVAAVAFAARAEIPAKPRTSYKVSRWVDKVKTVRNLAKSIIDGTLTEAKFKEKIGGFSSLQTLFLPKVTLLEGIDRAQWNRIGAVNEYPTAYRYDEDGKQIPSPSVLVEIDGKHKRFEGAKSVAEILDQMDDALGVAPTGKKMQFEVRTNNATKVVYINKKGDKEYRKLKTFTTTKEAFDFIKGNYDDLVAAWEDVKASDNVLKTDVRSDENRPRSAQDWREGKDVTTDEFEAAFGFRGTEFGNWVNQGKSDKERQWMLNQAYDALMDLADIVGIPPKATSLNGSLGLGFGSRGKGNYSAHYEPSNIIIALTKTKGAGSLAHEWFHALDNYFSRMRGGEVKMTNAPDRQRVYRQNNYITYKPEPMYVHKTKQSGPLTKEQLERYHAQSPKSEYYNPENWHKDPKHPEGVRPEVETAFAELVSALSNSPMKARAAKNDKGVDGYWSRIIELGARSFENFVISRMMEKGYHNDYLANVRPIEDFPRSKERYPYLLPSEIEPIAESFDNLFGMLETKETDKGVAIYSKADDAVPEAERLTDSEIVSIIEPILEKFGGADIPVRISESVSDVVPSSVGMDDQVASGVVYQGVIHLFRDGVSDRESVVRTLFHEMFHYGVRRFMSRDQYIEAMQKLYNSDPTIRNVANAWLNSKEAKDLYAKTNDGDYVTARGVDEALAEVAAEIKARDIKGTVIFNKKNLTAFENIKNWLAWVAKKFGFDKVAEALETKTADVKINQATRDFILSMFAKLESGAAPENAMRNWAYSDPSFMTAWHGSPHDHDKFDSSKIGTGEGAQAYGHGLYFASNKEVAEHYREVLTVGENYVDGESLDTYNPMHHLASVLNQESGNVQDATDALNSTILRGGSNSVKDVAKHALQLLESGSRPSVEYRKPNGKLYQVELAPSENEYLDWDRPLSEQSEFVQNALRGVSFEYPINDGTKGEDIYLHTSLDSSRGFENVGYKGASDFLHSIGIRGIRYLDGSSRDQSGVKWKDGVDSTKYDKMTKGVAENYLRDRGDVAAAIAKLKDDYVASKAKQYADAAMALESGDLVQDLNHNYVIFNDADVSIVSKDGVPFANAGVESPEYNQSAIQDYHDYYRKNSKGFNNLPESERAASSVAESWGSALAGIAGNTAEGKGAIRGDGPVLRGSRYTSIANGIAADFEKQGITSLVGKKIDGPADLAVAAQVYRDPRLETARYFFTKNGVIVGQNSFSSRKPGVTKIFAGDTNAEFLAHVADASDQMKALGADAVWLLHNHPSGDPTPSRADVDVTYDVVSAFVANGLDVHGHIIINSGKYAVIDSNGAKVSSHDFGKDARYDLSKPKQSHSLLGRNINSAKDLALHAKMAQLSPSQVVIIGLSGSAGIRTINEVTPSQLRGKFGARILGSIARQTGSERLFAYGIAPEDINAARAAINSGLLMDAIIIEDGVEYSLVDMDKNAVIKDGFSSGSEDKGIAVNQGVSDFVGSAKEAVSDVFSKETPSTIGKWVKSQVAQRRPFMLGFLTLDQIADVYGKAMNSVKRFVSVVQAMDTEKQKIADEADKIVERWRQLSQKEADKLADIMHEATIMQYDPDTSIPSDPDFEVDKPQEELRMRFAGLSDDAQQIYRDVRESYKKTIQQVRDGLADRVDRSTSTGMKIGAEIRLEFDKYLAEGPYFPLARFGDFILISDNGMPDGRIVESFESVFERDKMKAERLRSGYSPSQIKETTKQAYTTSKDGAAGKFANDVIKHVQAMDMDLEAKTALIDDLNQLAISSLPDQSYRKHFMHRKGVAGFSNDAMRAFSNSQFHAAHHIAKINHADQLSFIVDDITKEAVETRSGDVTEQMQIANELKKRLEDIVNPKTGPVAAAMGQVGFVMSLGGNIASGITNLSQTPMITFPWLGAKFGYDKAASAMTKASKDYFGGKWDKWSGYVMQENPSLTDSERKMLQELQDSGKIDLTQAHDLAAVANQNSAQSKGSYARSRAMKIIGWTFHLPEVFNRQTSALAAYRLATDSGMSHDEAVSYAANTLDRTHFNYAQSNRARHMNGDLVRVLTMFKQYSQQMTYMLWRNAYQALKGETPEVRREARRLLYGILTMHFMAAGSLGLPLGAFGISTILLPIASMMLGDGDDPWEWEVEYRKMLADTFGTKGGEMIAHGALRGILPWADFAGRVGLNDLWVRPPAKEMEGRAAIEAWMQTLAGPVFGYVGNIGTAAKLMNEGNFVRGVEAMVPKMIAAPMKAVRYATDGVQSMKGDDLGVSLNALDIAFTAAGFSPSDTSEMYEARNAIKNREHLLDMRRKQIINHWHQARKAGDTDGVQEAKEMARNFNEANKGNKGLQITPATLAKSAAAKERNADQIKLGAYLSKGRESLRSEGRFADVTSEQ